MIIENFSLLEKTDELDLFFGRCGRNYIVDSPKAIQFTQKWIEIVTPYQSSFTYKVFNKKTLPSIQARHHSRLMNSRPKGNGKKLDEFKITDELMKTSDLAIHGIRKEALPLINFFDGLEALDYEFALCHIRNMSQLY